MDETLPMPPEGDVLLVFPTVNHFCISSKGHGFYINVRNLGFMMSSPYCAFLPPLPQGHVEVGKIGPFVPVNNRADVQLIYYDKSRKETYVTTLQVRESCS